MCPPTTSTASETVTTTKTVYLIRHAESEENRRLSSLGRSFRALTKFSLPSASDLRASTELLNVSAQVDSSVSEIGAKQIAHMEEKLKQSNFLVSAGVQLVAHSPLLRARETSEGMLGCVAPDKKAESVGRVEELDLLMEKTPQEWTPLYYKTFKQRIADLEQWIADQPEDKITLVGHSQFFKAMLGLDFKFGNCDVWQISFDGSKRVREGEEAGAAPDDNKKVEDAASPSGVEEDKPTWKLPPQWNDLKIVHPCDVLSFRVIE